MNNKKRHNSIKTKLRAHEMFGSFKYRSVLNGISVGFVTGIVVSVFRSALSYADGIRNSLIDASKASQEMLLPALLVLAVLTVVVVFCVKNEPMIGGSGIPQVKGELEGYFDLNWVKIIIYKLVGGFCAITGGLSLGREGPSIQLGAMVGKGISSLSPKMKKEKDLLIIGGAGAGLAAAFSAPLAGVVFTMEELRKNYTTDMVLCTMAACITSDWMASYIFGLRPVFTLSISTGLPLSRYWQIVVLGIALGVFGALYNRSIEMFQNFFQKLRSSGKAGKAAGIVVPFITVIVLAIWYPDVLGSGHDLVTYSSIGDQGIIIMMTLLAVKFLFSVFSFGTGAPGGIFLPLLVLGAITGSTYSEIIGNLFGYSNEYVTMFVILGMAGYFSAIVRAPLTGIVLISEMTGVFSNLLPLSIVSFIAYMVAELSNAVPVYDQLLDRILRNKGIKEEKSRHSRLR